MSKSGVQKLRKLSLLFLIPILLLGFFIFTVKASEANHLVISAVQITGGEGKTNYDFIEIYNPTNQDVNLKGYRLVKRTKAGTSDTSIKSWTDDAIIKARGWRLWVSSDDAAFSASLSADDLTKQTISSDNGVAIRKGMADTGEIIDSLAWGAAQNIFREGAIPANPGAGEVLVRKPGTSSGNGEDTDNNANDFFVSTSYKSYSSGIQTNSSDQELNEPVSTNNNTSDQQPAIPTNNNSNNSSLLKPIIAEAGSDKEAVIGEAVNFDASDSIDPEGKILEYAWFFGDGVKAEGISASHAFNSVGEYKVILKVTSGSRISEDSLNVRISEPEFYDKVIINEIMPDPKGADKDGEWIELFNSGDQKINLKGWKLDDEIGGGSKPYVFSVDAFIDAKNFLVIKRNESDIVLPNKGGEANLLWYNDKNISKAYYGEAKEGQSYALIGGKWQWSDNLTPGKENSRIVLVDKTALSDKKEITVSSRIIRDSDPDEEPIQSSPQSEIAGVAAESGGIEKEEKILENKISSNDFTKERGNGDKNNPWILGNMALSVVSLFLVWRYQSLKKRVK